jgi:hypothetical protein
MLFTVTLALLASLEVLALKYCAMLGGTAVDICLNEVVRVMLAGLSISRNLL